MLGPGKNVENIYYKFEAKITCYETTAYHSTSYLLFTVTSHCKNDIFLILPLKMKEGLFQTQYDRERRGGLTLVS